MGIEDLTLKSCYIGDREVVKLYKGDTLIYEKSSGGGKIYERNGDLIIPAGTVCQIEDYSSAEPVTIEYVLPSDIVISGTNGEVTLSDGQRVRYYASVTETQTVSPVQFEYVKYQSWVSRETETITVSTTTMASGTRRDVGYYLTIGRDNGIVRVPYAAFKPVNNDTVDTYGLNFYTSLSYYENSTYIKGIYLHDFGTEPTEGWWNPVDPSIHAITEELISPNDVSCRFRDYYIYVDDFQYKLIPGHHYLVYALVDSSYTKYPSEFSYDSIRSCRWSGAGRKTVSHYDEPLSVRLSGYKFGEDQEVQASISYYDYPERLGTAKINEELKYYDVVPNE